MIDPADEALHPVGDSPHWQESFYFNWSDPRHEVFGLARIGYRFNDDRLDGLVLTIREGRPEFCYPGVGLRRRGPWSDQNPDAGFQAGRLSFALDEPLQRLRLRLTGRDELALTFDAFTPPFDYADAAGVLSDLGAAHFEQSGRVTGWTRFKGTRLEIDGTGQRDKSWGSRDWGKLLGWDWITAQFGNDLAFNVTRIRGPDRDEVTGFVFRDGKNHAIEAATIDYRWGKRPHLPAEARLQITDEGGGLGEVRVECLGCFPLFRKGAWIEEVQARFQLTGDGGALAGVGVVEHVWRPSAARVLRQAPELLGTLRTLTVP